MRDTMRPIMHPGRANEETPDTGVNRGPGADARGGYAREAYPDR